MHILISNDDGIFAEGIETLARALLPLGTITVVAPNRERSAASHSLTLEHPLRARKTAFPVPVHSAFSITGTPSDCVKLAISQLLPTPPDLVVTGINCGANLSVDVFYSGTVAAAFEGIFNHIPAIAFSLATRDPNAGFAHSADLVKTFVEWALQNPAPTGVLYNVNIPAIEPDARKGWRLTKLGSVRYRDSYALRQDPHNRPYYWLTGKPEILDHSPDADIVAVRDGYVSVTPIRAELTDFGALQSLQNSFTLK
jgi:5'-nucleotidase